MAEQEKNPVVGKAEETARVNLVPESLKEPVVGTAEASSSGYSGAKLAQSNPIPTKPASTSKKELLTRLGDLTEQALRNSGKPGHNPYQWVKTFVVPLQKEIEVAATVTEDMVKKVAALKIDTTVPKIIHEDRSYKPPTEAA